MSVTRPTLGLPDSLPTPLLTQEKYQETVFETWDDGFDASYQGFSFFLVIEHVGYPYRRLLA